MSCFDINDNISDNNTKDVDVDDDIDILLLGYSNDYMEELTYYGTSKSEQMIMLINLGQRINRIEKKIFISYYNHYVKLVLNDISDPNIYNLHRIFYAITNLIVKMVMLFVLKQSDTEEFRYKLRYLVGNLESYVDKVIVPIESKIKAILDSNTIFELKYPTTYLNQFVELNKSKFTSKEKVYKLKKLLRLLDDI
jgi:hypothetical protein